MRAEAARADRAREVREAARQWQRAGAIDGATLRSIEAAYPDDRVRLGPAFRALAFLFTVVAVLALIGLLAVVLDPRRHEWLLLFAVGLALVALTELQIGPLRRSEGGTESATAWLGVGLLVASCAWFAADALHLKGGDWWALAWGCAAVSFGAAAVRWGDAGQGLVAAVAVFLLLGWSPWARLLWVVIATAAIPVFLRGSRSGRLAPAQRRGCLAALGCCIVALYLAVHLGSWDHGWVEDLGWRSSPAPPPPSLRPAAIAMTAALPVALLAWGIATRHRVVLWLGWFLAACSLVTLRWYVHLAPAWLALTAAGAALIALALAVRRTLDSAPGREFLGFTAAPLFEDPAGRERLAAVVTLAAGPRLQPPASAETGRLRPGGGGYGGGGATGEY